MRHAEVLAELRAEARFWREAAAALPLDGVGDAASVYEAMDWRRLRLRQDQQVPEWGRALAREA